MQGFRTVLLEDRNTHLEHLEDEIINNGTSGARTSIEFLKSIKAVDSVKDFPSELKLKWAGSPRLRVTIYAKVQIAGDIQNFEEDSQTLWIC